MRARRARRASGRDSRVCVCSAAEDVLLRAVDASNSVRVSCVVARTLVQSAVSRHEMSPTAAAALGRGLMGTLLLISGREEGESVQALFRGDGSLGSMLVIADSGGNVKGRVGNPTAGGSDGSLNVGAIVGNGTLSVSRLLPFSKEPYTGTGARHEHAIAILFTPTLQHHSVPCVSVSVFLSTK